MRLILVILLSISTSLYGWAGSLTAHIEEQCHVVEDEHHEESLSDHEEAHHATPGQEQHDAEAEEVDKDGEKHDQERPAGGRLRRCRGWRACHRWGL